jgi:hypothetical protein
MSNTVRPVRGGIEPAPAEEQPTPQDRAREICSGYVPWTLGRRPLPDEDPMAGLAGSRVDLTYVSRRRRLRR